MLGTRRWLTRFAPALSAGGIETRGFTYRRNDGLEFPALLQSAVSAHHDPEAAQGSGRTLAMLVRAAHVVVADPEAGWKDAEIPEAEGAALLADLGLLPEDVDDLRQELGTRLKEALAVL